MKKSPILVGFILCALTAAAQPMSTVPKNIRASNTLANLFDPNGLSTSDNLYGIPMELGEVRGDTYLQPDWKRTTLMLYDVDKMVEGYPARYEIEHDQFEIKAGGAVKVLNGKKVKSFVWIDSISRTPHYFVNGRDLKTEDNMPLTGFLEVITEGRIALLSRTEVVVMNPNHHQALNMGTRDTRIVKKHVFYLLENGVLKAVPSSKKKLLPLFGEHAPEVSKFIRVNALSLNEPTHLRALVEHYNTLVVTN